MTPTTSRQCSVAEAGTTARIRRRPPGKFGAFIQGRLPLQRDGSPPPPLPRPRGDLRSATIRQITETASATWPQRHSRGQDRQSALQGLLGALEACGGETWQDRWVSGGFNRAGHPVSRISAGGPVTPALAVLFALRVITPSVSAVRTNRLLGYPGLFRAGQADPALDALFTAAGQLIPHEAIRREALTDITVALTTEAVALADLTPGRFLNYVLDSRTHVITAARHQRKRYRGYHAWDLLHRAGRFPPGTPDTLKEAIREPRLTPAELVARHDIADPGVRQLLADYLTVRGTEMDYSSLRTLAAHLAGLFWKQVETLAPGQRDLRLPAGLYEQWRETLRWRQDGKPRKGQDPVLLAVRSFYFDLSAWALQEPARWAAWVAPCPVPQRELRGIARRRRKVTEETADRTRQRQPLLPRLIDQARHDHLHHAELLKAGQAAAPGQTFTAGGRTWTRVFSPADARREREHGRAHVRLRESGGATGRPRRPGGRTCLLGLGDHRDPSPERHPHRGAPGDFPAQHPPVPAPERRGRRPARHRPVQDRPRACHPDVRRALRRRRRDHPPPHARGPRDPRGGPLRPARAGDPAAAALPVPAPRARLARP